jgi:peroxiredoxin family protein/TusA-related sulfurtransferase
MNPLGPFATDGTVAPTTPATRELDCRSQPCPVPVLRLAKAANEVGPGGRLLIRADDPAFPKDLRAWARSARAQIVRFDDRGDCFEADISIGGDGPGSLPTPAPVIHRGTPGSSPELEGGSGSVSRAVPPSSSGPVPSPVPRPASAPWMAELSRESRANLEPVAHATATLGYARGSSRASGSQVSSRPRPHTPARSPLSAAAAAPMARSPRAPSARAPSARAQSAPLAAAPSLTPLGPVRQTFDLREQPPELLLDIIAKACERAEPGAILAVIAGDPQLGPRLEGLVQTIDATLLECIERDTDSGRQVEARVRVEPPISSQPQRRSAPQPVPHQRPLIPTAAPAPTTTEPERCTLLVLHNDHEALLAALLIANGAAAAGMDTSVFFTFWGLNLLRGSSPNLAEPAPRITLMQRLMKWMMPKGPTRQPLGKMHFAGLGKGMLSSIMREQQVMSLPELLDSAQQLGVRFTACTMSMNVMGIAPRDLHPYPNLDYGGVASFVGDARGSAIHMVF